MSYPQTRRSFLTTSAALAVTPFLLNASAASAAMKSEAANASDIAPSTNNEPRYCLNAGSIRGFDLPVEEEIDIAAKAGYQGIELWIDRITAFQRKGGKLADLKKRLDDHGLQVENGMAFFCWATNDDAKRAAGIEQMKREMEMLRELGCPRIAATASGVTGERLNDFETLGRRYRDILEIGEPMRVIPQLEVWGGSQTFRTLSDAIAVATAAGHLKAAILLDTYHLYKGGSPFEGLRLLNGKMLQVFHINDYPAFPPRDQIRDSDRVYPRDGICPLPQILGILKGIGFFPQGVLSFEVFNPDYWKNDTPLGVATKGLEKMRYVVSKIGE